ncbi:MAG: relaxase/mobilization nuclease domain-containing protein [Campylobacteraceae bacterium]|nr:relaxase/mobilization nuclease domain-containing protein [Campylobacteraceae bacterium]
MLVKFFKNRSGGSLAGIDYLLNHRVEAKTAYVLKGDEAITRAIVKNLNKKQKLTIGCLSFEEQNIEFKTKQTIIDEFENMIFGEYRDRFNILWVEHVDKGRLELNFAIPKIDLESGLSFNPYYHKSDMLLVDSWQNYINLKFNFSDPKDPEKAHMLQGLKKELNLIKNYLELEEIFIEKFQNGDFDSRDEIVSSLKNAGIAVTRIGSDYISVKLPGSKKPRRFKGIVFSEKFTSIENLIKEDIGKKARDFKDKRDKNIYIAKEEQGYIFNYFKNGMSKKEIKTFKFKQNFSNEDRELARLKRKFDIEMQKRNKWLKNEISRLPKRKHHLLVNSVDAKDNDISLDFQKQQHTKIKQKSMENYKWKLEDHKIKILLQGDGYDVFRARVIKGIRDKRTRGEQKTRALESSLERVCQITSKIRLLGGAIGETFNALSRFSREFKTFREQNQKYTKYLDSFSSRIKKAEFERINSQKDAGGNEAKIENEFDDMDF